MRIGGLTFEGTAMLESLTRLGIISGLAILMGSCATEYTYTPPITAEGRECVAQCQVTQSSCRNDTFQSASDTQRQCQSNAAEEQDQCERASAEKFSRCEQESQTEYFACLKYASNRAACNQVICVKESCSQPGCFNAANFTFCDSEFRGCYQNCGGSVGILK
jgi:hypothetical protein